MTDETNTLQAAPETQPTPVAPASMRGITRTMNTPAAGQVAEMRGDVSGQSLSLVLFLAALLPPIVLGLVRGLSGALPTVPYASLWAWGAVAIAIVVSVRCALSTFAGGRLTAIGPLAAAVFLLLVPATVVLILRLRLYPVPFAVAVTQVVLYTASALALLLGRSPGFNSFRPGETV